MIELVEGYTYFLIGFHDSEFTQPCITTVIYDGKDNDSNIGHVFRVSSGGSCVCFEEGKINNIVDRANLIKWLQKEHSPKLVGETYEYMCP